MLLRHRNYADVTLWRYMADLNKKPPQSGQHSPWLKEKEKNLIPKSDPFREDYFLEGKSNQFVRVASRSP